MVSRQAAIPFVELETMQVSRLSLTISDGDSNRVSVYRFFSFRGRTKLSSELVSTVQCSCDGKSCVTVNGSPIYYMIATLRAFREPQH